jgi:plasmid stability protein
MSLIVNVPDEVARRLEAAAAARGVTVEEFAAEVLAENTPAVGEASRRRRLGFVGIGASEQGISHRVGELLADGFGRD